MRTPTPFEQELLELINRARLDPQGEYDHLILSSSPVTGATTRITHALSYFGVDLDLFRQQLQGLPSVAPLAWNSALADAANYHSGQLILADEQSHQVSGELSLWGRIDAAGYAGWNRFAENVFAYTKDPVYGHAGFYIDWGHETGGIQNPAGHRNNILDANLTEVGIAALAEQDDSTSVGPYVVTQDFGTRFDYAPQVVGVAYDDLNNDGAFQAGEGLADTTVTFENSTGRFQTASWSSGGYQIALTAGTYSVTWSGPGFTSSGYSVTIADKNVKTDFNRNTANLIGLPTIGISPSMLEIAEGGSGATAFTFTVARSGDTGSTSSVNWTVAGSGASPANASDFTGGAFPSGTISFAAGETSRTVTVNVAGDTVVEAHETFTIALQDAQGATIETGSATGRITGDDLPPGFDPLLYLASNPDLANLWGDNQSEAREHFLAAGFREGRPAASFSPMRYLASNPDLARLWGANENEALHHYVAAGAREGRQTNSFDALRYLASNPDLARLWGANETEAIGHYVAAGAREGRPTVSFDSLLYLASNPDLASLWGINEREGLGHYVNAGVREGRPTSGFDPLQYLAANSDLASLWGVNEGEATRHYVAAGAREGRPTSGFDAFGYLVANGDLGNAGLTEDSALDHYVRHGVREGRATGFFGGDQGDHSGPVAGGTVSGTLGSGSDQDWFRVVFDAGRTYTIDLEGGDSGAGTLADPFLRVFDANGRLLAQDDDAGTGSNSRLSLTAPASGRYYLATLSDSGTTGTYRLGLAVT